MQNIAWHFTKVRPSHKNREAMQGEFFAANKSIASALIREAIQNSLDARLEEAEGPVKMRVYLSGDESALSPENAEFFFEGAWQHYMAEDSGLRNCPRREDPCKFFVIEDFNTTGLTGDIYEYTPPGNTKNAFYSFYRAEGQSNKSHTDRGRWGVGKFIFPKASRMKTFFGLTVRNDDLKKYFVGQTILKSHKVDGISYTPDGWFGWTHEVDEDEKDYLHMPVDDQEGRSIVERFCDTFKLQRRNESGLSVVVPYIDEDIDCRSVVKAILDDYFWPILTGDLCVAVECQNETYEIETGSLSRISESFQDDQAGERKAHIELAKWGTTLDREDFVSIQAPKVTAAPKWSEELIDAELRVELRKRLEAEERIALRIPITIREKQGEDRETFYDVFLQRNPDAKSGMPVFIREGIIIPNVNCKKTPRTVALVVADEPVIADFLGNAENPAHTDWHHNSENFKDKYYYGDQALRFVKNSVAHIIRILDESSKQEDRTLLLDIFSIPMPSEGPQRPDRKRRNKKEGPESEVPPEIPPAKAKRYKVTKVHGGFTISNGDKPMSLPVSLDVRVFYDRRTGRAKYNINDFRLEKRPLKIASKGMKLIQTKGNRLIAEIHKQKFRLTVKGFDQKRDVLVKPSIIEREAADAKI